MTKKAMGVLALFAAALMANGAAFAQEHGPRDPAAFEKRFKEADKNGDGKLSKEEAEGMPMIAKNFDTIDAKKTGGVSMDDVKGWMASRRPAGGAPAPAGQ